MPLPKQVKPNLQLVPPKTLLSRREQLLEYINKDGTYLPKSVLHADLDRGMLDFVRTDLQVVTAGKIVPLLDIIITTQNWSQYLETWKFVDLDYNPSPPFVTVVRKPEVKFGTNPAIKYNIPNRKQFYYASVPTWNGNMKGMDIYTIPQPVPVDINYTVAIICNRMRELNELNKVVMQKFSSRQAYTFIKGQYVPIVLDNISDSSQMSMESRKYYVQNYDFTMLGYLIDENEFEVKPAVARVTQLIEVDSSTRKKKRDLYPKNPDEFPSDFRFVPGNSALTTSIEFTADMNVVSTNNISSYDVFINGDYYGQDVPLIQITTNDVLKIEVNKTNDSEESNVVFNNVLYGDSVAPNLATKAIPAPYTLGVSSGSTFQVGGGLKYEVGQSIRVYHNESANQVSSVISYDVMTGLLSFSGASQVIGSGTYWSWNIF